MNLRLSVIYIYIKRYIILLLGISSFLKISIMGYKCLLCKIDYIGSNVSLHKVFIIF